MSRLQTPIRRNDTVVITTGKDAGKRGRVLKIVPDEEPRARRGRQPDQAPHQAEPGQEHQGRRGAARGDRCTPAMCSWYVPSAARKRASGTGCSPTGARSASAASAREWSTNEPPEREVRQRSCAGAEEGVRVHQRHGDPEDPEDRRQHGAGRGDGEREDHGRGDRRARPHHRPEARRPPREEINRAVQGARGYAGRRDR